MGNCFSRKGVVSNRQQKGKLIEISEMVNIWKTGDIIAFKKSDTPYYYYGIIAKPASGIHEPIPAFLVYGVDHNIKLEPLELRIINVKSVMSIIFYSVFDDFKFIRVDLPDSFQTDLNM